VKVTKRKEHRNFFLKNFKILKRSDFPQEKVPNFFRKKWKTCRCDVNVKKLGEN